MPNRPLLDSDPTLFDVQTKAVGPSGSLPLSDEMLRTWSSGDLFGLSQNAGMGWRPDEMLGPQFLLLSTQGGVSVNPPGLAIPGQRMVGKTGSRWLPMKASFEFTLIDEPNGKLELNVELPFGIAVHESLDCVRIDGVRCRVNYHCHFGLPVGWRGSLLRRLIGKGFEHGPADSLRRLKDAAEQVYRRRMSEGTRPDNRGV